MVYGSFEQPNNPAFYVCNEADNKALVNLFHFSRCTIAVSQAINGGTNTAAVPCTSSIECFPHMLDYIKRVHWLLLFICISDSQSPVFLPAWIAINHVMTFSNQFSQKTLNNYVLRPTQWKHEASVKSLFQHIVFFFWYLT